LIIVGLPGLLSLTFGTAKRIAVRRIASFLPELFAPWGVFPLPKAHRFPVCQLENKGKTK
jgi:hypothetical protein